MIGYLSGSVKFAKTGEIVLLTNGVGFSVRIPASVNPVVNSSIELYIHTHLRDDELSLYGFQTFEDLKLFELLISVSGVGPRTALNIFSMSNIKQITEAISTSNLSFFTSISGVAKKTAQKIILDLKSKLSKGDVNLESLEGHSDLIDALISLGYQKTEIASVVTSINTSADLQAQIKQALKLLA